MHHIAYSFNWPLSMAAHSTNHFTDITDVRKYFCSNTAAPLPAMYCMQWGWLFPLVDMHGMQLAGLVQSISLLVQVIVQALIRIN